jgi:cardiolipin synthase
MRLKLRSPQAAWAMAAVVMSLVALLFYANLTGSDEHLEHAFPHRYAACDPQFRRTSSNLLGPPAVNGNRITTLLNGDQAFPAMLDAIRSARHSLTFEGYIFWSGEVARQFADAFSERARNGVPTHLVLDWLGSKKMDQKHLQQMRQAGVEIVRYHPLRWYDLDRVNKRTHRKILVVDGRVGFSGSQNLIEPCYDKPKNQKLGRAWVELMARIEGPAVHELDIVFATDWFKETGERLRPQPAAPLPSSARPGAQTDVGVQVVPSGPGFEAENNLRLFNSMLYSAERRLSVTSPYFVPDDSLMYAVTTAAQRGVEVELFVGATADQFMVAHAQRSYYDALLAAGVRIWLYPEPFVLHAKHFSIDDHVAVVGSSNMDMRSFALNYEVVMMMTGEAIVSRLAEVQAVYRSLSTELTSDIWRERSRGARYVDNLMRLTATLQ